MNKIGIQTTSTLVPEISASAYGTLEAYILPAIKSNIWASLMATSKSLRK